MDLAVLFGDLVDGLTPLQVLFVFMSIIVIMALTELIKFPIKKYLVGRIASDDVRKKVNIVFMILPIVLGVLEGWVCQSYGLFFSQARGAACGTTAVFIFELITRIFKATKGTSVQEIIDSAKASVNSAKKTFETTCNNITKKTK